MSTSHILSFRRIALGILAAMLLATSAEAVDFRAEVDRDEIAQDESVSLKLVVQTDNSASVQDPEFNAPDFEEIQNYQGQFVNSYYDSSSGKFGAKFTRSYTFVLRPKKTGKLQITNIRVKVEGEPYSVAPVTITVSGGGAGTPPPRGYGGAGAGLRGAAKKARGQVLFLRTEVDKTKAYKGEQIVVNYYLYSRARNFNATADRYPTLPGFLKEELDIPVLTGRLEAQNVLLEGTAYKRVLIASFAAYPLKEGKLSIDPMEVKASYIADRPNRGGGDTSDPFGFGDEEDLFQHFFQNVAPQTENLRSETVAIEVLPLPPVPSGVRYSGGVGEFDVISAVDRTDLKAHEALNLTLKVEGKGNLSNIETPKIALPEGFELYESKSQTRGKAGIGEKVFEYLLIPRTPGDFTLPAIEVGFFDPKKGEYVQKTTEPFRIHVNPGDPGAENSAPERLDPSKEIASPQKDAKRFFDLSSDGAAARSLDEGFRKAKGPWKVRLIVGLILVVILALIIRFRKTLKAVLGNLGAGLRRRKQSEKDWAKAHRQAEEAQRLPFQEILKTYAFIESELEKSLTLRFSVSARGLTRTELKEALVDRHGIAESQWQRLSALLEFTETVRFASQAGAISEERARNELRKWVGECEALLSEFKSKTKSD